jgi:hypothetical protein
MAMTLKEEARALNTDERDLVEKSHHPALQEISDSDLSDLVKLIRERREKAKTQAYQRRRELRGKADPKGTLPSGANEGSNRKLVVLSTAMRRVNKEVERRRRMVAGTSLIANAKRALAMKQASESNRGGAPFNSRHAHEGMRNLASKRKDSLIRPMERGRLRKAASVAQAKRDAR